MPLIKDAWRAENWKDKFTIWFKPTGWRPENFEEKYPVNKIENVFNFDKYGTQNSQKLIYWSVVQMLITLLFVSYLFDNIAKIGLPNIFIYGFFILITIYSYTELMDKNKYAIFWEGLRFAVASGIILYFGDWFGLNTIFSAGNYIILAYLALSFLTTIYFVAIDFKKPMTQTANLLNHL
ncbi:hypothetical protein [Flavobacterium daemonense]|uniref:hypothetical protein n=1 Tax=Flavobacterium daemonense TaxID=1393049 RepID=UPI001FE4BF36|nr:hypothetical protein [Flavobacterium daemonense]